MASGNIAELFVKIGVDYKDFEAGLNEVGSMLGAVGAQLQSIGMGMTAGITMPLAAIGTAAAKSAIELDAQMRNIQSISQQSDADIAQLQQRFIDLSTDMSVTTDSAANLAAGFYQIQSSGFSGEDAMQILLASSKAATAGLTDTSTAAYTLTAALNAYGESADMAGAYSDVMFRAVDIGVMSFEELATSLGNVLSTASMAGVSFETVAASMATMTKQGLSAAEASVSLNQVLLSLIDPSRAMSAALADIGFESGQAALDTLGLQGVLQALTDAGYGSAEAMAKIFPNVRALRGAMSLTGKSTQMFTQDLKAMANAMGATDAAFEQQMKSFSSQLDNLRNTATALGIEMFNTVGPSFSELITKARDATQGLRDLSPAVKQQIVSWGLYAAAVGPALTVLGGVMRMSSGVIAVFSSLAGSIGTAFTTASVGIAAFSKGLTAATSMSIMGGLSGIASVLAGIASAAVLAGAAMLGLNAAVGAANSFMMAKSKDDWGEFFKTYSSGAYSAAGAAQAFADKQAELNKQNSQNYLVVSGQVDATKQQYQAFWDAEAALNKLSTSYSDYVSAVQTAGLPVMMAATEESWNLTHGITAQNEAMVQQASRILNTSANYTQYAERLETAGLAHLALEEATYNSIKAHTDLDNAIDGTSKTAANARAKYEEAASAVNAIGEKLKEAGIVGEQYNSIMAAVAAEVGVVNQSQSLLTQTTTALTAAVKAGTISETYYAKAMADAQLAGISLTQSQIDLMNARTAMVQSAEMARLATIAQNTATLDLAQTLMDATPAQVAAEAISGLRSMMDAGTLSGDAFNTAFKSIGMEFGLMSEKSFTTAVGVQQLAGAIQEGAISAENAGPAYKAMLDQIDKAGAVDMDALINQFGEVPDAVEAASEAAGAYGEQLEALDGAKAETSVAVKGADAAISKVKAASQAVEAFAGDTYHYIHVVTVYEGGSGPAAAATPAASPYGDQSLNPDSYVNAVTATPLPPPPSPGFADTGVSTGFVLPPPTGTFTSTTTTATDTGFSTEPVTYNVYNPLAAALLIEQRHIDALTRAEAALK